MKTSRIRIRLAVISIILHYQICLVNSFHHVVPYPLRRGSTSPWATVPIASDVVSRARVGYFMSPRYAHRSTRRCTPSRRLLSRQNDQNEGSKPSWTHRITENRRRSILFSILMAAGGALLGPFLDSYHSAFGILQYEEPIQLVLWGSLESPALTTAWWVPGLFALAGFLIGWLYILLDFVFEEPANSRILSPGPPKILLGISFFTLQYWLSGSLVEEHVDRTAILNLMSVVAAIGFWVLDGTMTGLVTSAATAIGGPLIEVGLIWCTTQGILTGGYHYTDLGETGFFPLWILPVYFLGGPANGNLARGLWKWLSREEEEREEVSEKTESTHSLEPCSVCNDTRRVPCPNCDGVGTYVAMGGQSVTCTSCRGRGYVMCRACFDRYDDDPYDIDAIRDKMSRMPD